MVLTLCALGLCGCSHNYVMRLNNGLRITTASKPKLKDGAFYYKDGLGRVNSIPAGRVREIAPASMAEEESGRFRPWPSK